MLKKGAFGAKYSSALAVSAVLSVLSFILVFGATIAPPMQGRTIAYTPLSITILISAMLVALLMIASQLFLYVSMWGYIVVRSRESLAARLCYALLMCVMFSLGAAIVYVVSYRPSLLSEDALAAL